MCTNYQGNNDCLEFYTGLLNSKLYGFYFRKFYSEEDDLFPKIKVNELKNLPIKKCADDCRKGKGPFLIEAMTFRIRGHEEASGVKYVPNSLIKKWKKKDPIKMLEKKLLKDKILIKKDVKSISEKFKFVK